MDHDRVRVALPGVQVLFAFLLAVPFANGWQRVTDFQRCLLRRLHSHGRCIRAPDCAERLPPAALESRRPGRTVEISNGLVIAGLLFLAISIVAVVLLVADYIFGRTTAIATTAAIGAAFLSLWYGPPLGRWLARRADHD